jgi:hypothetical protein
MHNLMVIKITEGIIEGPYLVIDQGNTRFSTSVRGGARAKLWGVRHFISIKEVQAIF